MRDDFHQELEELSQKLLKMGSLVEERIHKSIKALTEQDSELAAEVINGDDVVDDYENKIEKKCIDLLVLQQPVARDMRQIIVISKIANDLERIADLAQNTARIADELSAEEFIKPLVDIPKMSRIAQDMVRDGLDAFIDGDQELAAETARRDSEVDRLDDQVLRELLTYMMEDSQMIKQGNRLMFVSRYLERIADHATNICEEVIYMITAEQVHF
jgi:phosphate transport system protein